MTRALAALTMTILLGLTPYPGGGRPAPPTDSDIVFYQDVAWSPDGKRLAASSMRIPRALWEKERYGALRKSQFDIQVISVDGTSAIQVTDGPGNDLWAVWWPGGRCLLYAAERDGASSLSYVKADGSDRQTSKGRPESATQPAVSPDGRKIAFMSRQGSESHIYVTEAGNPPHRVTSSGPNNWNPVWSPDGARIVFYSDRRGSGRDQIFTVAADGSDETQLTSDEHNNIFPSWSLDGGKVLFASNRDGKGKEGIYVMEADGSNVRRLVPDVRAFFARWSPDGKKLAFIAGEFPETRIFVADADGARATPLTN